MRRVAIVVVIAIAALAAFAVAQPPADKNNVSVSVLGLFHPQEVEISPANGELLECKDGAGADLFFVDGALDLRRQSTKILLRSADVTKSADSVFCDNGQGAPTNLLVTIAGKISRRYRGELEIRADARELLVLVRMNLETAVASVVAAESPPGAPQEMLKAQAVAARSFFVAGKGRHHNFDFCDTTHCQFLRQPPQSGSPAASAAAATQGMVLAYKDSPFAAMYSASCGGHTHSLQDLGIAVKDYPYYAVTCDYCLRHPEKWVAQLSEADASRLHATESSRLQLARKLGWQTVQSNSYSWQREQGSVLIAGVGKGHGIGLCQRGAADMARHGASFQEILAHYYPNTTVKELR